MNIENIIVVDTETTGTSPFINELLSLAFVPMDRSKPSLEVNVQISKNAIWSDFARRNFKNFEDRWNSSSITAKSAAKLVQEYLTEICRGENVILGGHNVGFDRAFLQKLAYVSGRTDFSFVSHRNYDTHTIIMDNVLRGKLPAETVTSTGAFDYFNISISEADRHTAIGDAVATRELIYALMRLG